MVELHLGSLAALLGLPTALTGFFFWLVERKIQKRDMKKEKEDAAHREQAKKDAEAWESLQLITIQGVSAAIALGEATARAVQRIPDAHCNGDMHAALDYAAEIKHKQKDFLSRQGVHSMLDTIRGDNV